VQEALPFACTPSSGSYLTTSRRQQALPIRAADQTGAGAGAETKTVAVAATGQAKPPAESRARGPSPPHRAVPRLALATGHPGSVSFLRVARLTATPPRPICPFRPAPNGSPYYLYQPRVISRPRQPPSLPRSLAGNSSYRHTKMSFRSSMDSEQKAPQLQGAIAAGPYAAFGSDCPSSPMLHPGKLQFSLPSRHLKACGVIAPWPACLGVHAAVEEILHAFVFAAPLLIQGKLQDGAEKAKSSHAYSHKHLPRWQLPLFRVRAPANIVQSSRL